MFAWIVLLYFVLVAGILRVFTSWDAKTLLVRSAALAVVCNLPLLLTGAPSVVAYVVLAFMAIRLLTQVFEAPMLAALLSIVPAAATCFGIWVAFG